MYIFKHALREKRCTTLLERQFKLLDLIQYSRCVLKDLNASVVITCLYISHLVPPHGLQQPFFFSRGATFALTRISFKLFALLNPIIGTFSKTFPCSLSGVNNKCISESTFLSFRKHWMISNIKNNSTFISHSLLFV